LGYAAQSLHNASACSRIAPQRNLALELLRTLLDDDIAVRSRRKVVQAHS
jgi:hypothetical protein